MLFKELEEPITYKKDTTTINELNKLKNIQKLLLEKNKINQDIKLLEYGLSGENKVLYELQNSHIGMYILHNMYFEYNNLNCQIDFIVITHENIYYIECKNLMGNIEIDENGNFNRVINYHNKTYREGMYSPYTQVIRHTDFMRKIALDNVKSFSKIIMGPIFDKTHIPLVVFVNDKTIIKDDKAPKKIQEHVIKIDQLIRYIKKQDNLNKKFIYYNDEDMKEFADSYIQVSTLKPNTFSSHYLTVVNNSQVEKLKTKLKNYRWQKANIYNIKPYLIYHNNTIEELVQKRPQTMEELSKISGMGEKSMQYYGKDILNILHK